MTWLCTPGSTRQEVQGCWVPLHQAVGTIQAKDHSLTDTRSDICGTADAVTVPAKYTQLTI